MLGAAKFISLSLLYSFDFYFVLLAPGQGGLFYYSRGHGNLKLFKLQAVNGID